MLVAALYALSAFQAEAEPSLCGVIETVIEPGHYWREEDITRERYYAALELLRERFPEWVDRAASRHSTDAQPSVFEGQIRWSWLNSLNIIEAYSLKLEAMSAPQTEQVEAVNRYCSFLGATVIYD